ncbi:hypothetical protein [Nocardia terpenica]|uniref:Secreted protein n=1 Tax=Nocardia terpenica TaxID=455432 RepID=A0A164J5Q6_9NOCA|nr:hypothetical protein [Nocardia terpenica]KZM70073.1 hypothetical protein AWN90_05710 [Nocardia terpenica]MBF6063979.1 hypothetical protein [Nocardia terpenica]MBF6107785.1 hypothetical protein [Nocardia terpenica]MBF6114853.1 hypothetical protein [Nocardia terpenica]MBF6121160.1 hypothetical protein [Nocardia terpenica]
MHAGTFALAGALASAVTLLGSGIAAADPAPSIPADGVYRVGIDILPGIYQAPGSPDPNHVCGWQRLWKIMGPGDDPDPNHYVIASDFTHVNPVRVLIRPSDVGFATANCGGWVLMPAPPSTGSYGPGGLFGSEY